MVFGLEFKLEYAAKVGRRNFVLARVCCQESLIDSRDLKDLKMHMALTRANIRFFQVPSRRAS